MKRFISIMMLLLMLLTMLTASGCKTAASADTAQSGTDGLTEIIKTTAEVKFIDTLPDYDFGGYVFMIVDKSPQYNAFWYTRDVYSVSQNGDTINDAVFERNTSVEEKFNITIKEANSSASPEDMLNKAVLAGDDIYDLITTGLAYFNKLIFGGQLVDLYTIEVIDLSNSWWDREMAVGVSIADKLYYITGDISIMDDMGTWCIVFNKDIIVNYRLGDPYELVKDGNWTLGAMFEMIVKATVDLDGDGVITQTDQFGFFTETFNNYGLWACAGNNITVKDENDLPVLAIYNDRSARVLEKVPEIQWYQGCVPADFFTFKSKTEMDLSEEYFAEGGGLFVFGGMKNISDFRASEVDFGIIPAPKYDAKQERYYSAIARDTARRTPSP